MGPGARLRIREAFQRDPRNLALFLAGLWERQTGVAPDRDRRR